MNKTLVNSVIRRVGGKETLRDVYLHGASGGFAGFTYYTDTVSFFRKHRAAIVSLAEEMAESLGMNVTEMVAGFNCLNNEYSGASVAKVLYGRYSNDDDYTMIANSLAWFALEEVARHVFDSVQ